MPTQREDTPKTGPAPQPDGAPRPPERKPAEPRGERSSEERFKGDPEKGHEEIGQFPDAGDFGPDDIKGRRA